MGLLDSGRLPPIRALVDDYLKGVRSPVAVIEEQLSLAEKLNPHLNAFVTISHERARVAAEMAHDSYQGRGPVGRLSGVPVTVKDNIQTQDIRTTFGSSRFRDNIPTGDAVCVARLVSAGAVLIGKSATPEFACRQTTSSPVSGISRNPLDPKLTPGGSSGGGAAATAAGIGAVAIVTDGGGSARLPAACTALSGFKPTLGRIPFETANDGFGGFAHIGLMAKHVTDVREAFAVMEGPHRDDPWSSHNENRQILRAGGLRPLQGVRVGWRMRLGDEPIDAEVERCFHSRRDQLQELGASLVPLLDEIEAPLPIWRKLQDTIWSVRYGNSFSASGSLDPVINSGIERANRMEARELQIANQGRTRLFRTVQHWFETCDVIVTPTLTRPPIAADHPGFGEIEICGRPAGDIRQAWAPFLGLFTMTGHPAISLNAGWTEHSSLPIGLHFVGPWRSDYAILDFAEQLEASFGATVDLRPPVTQQKKGTE